MTKRQRNWVMASLLLASLMSGLDATIINTALPAIISDLHGIQYMGWIVAVFRRFGENLAIESETRKPLDYRF